MNKQVLVPIANGCEEIETVGIIDILRRAGADVTVASVNQLHVTASRGVKLSADKLIDECANQTFDLIAIPGGIPGAEYIRDCPTLITMLKKQKQENRLYAAICASPEVVFQTHGLLDKKKATCHPSRIKNMKNKEACHQRVVVDGNCITSQGPGTAIEFSLELVKLLYGKDKAAQVGEALVI